MRKLHFFTCDSWKLQKAIVSVGCLLFFFFICSCFYWEDGIRGQIFLAFLKTFVRYFFLFLFVILNTSQIRVIVAQKYFSKSSPVLFSHINGGCEGFRFGLKGKSAVFEEICELCLFRPLSRHQYQPTFIPPSLRQWGVVRKREKEIFQ